MFFLKKRKLMKQLTPIFLKSRGVEFTERMFDMLTLDMVNDILFTETISDEIFDMLMGISAISLDDLDGDDEDIIPVILDVESDVTEVTVDDTSGGVFFNGALYSADIYNDSAESATEEAPTLAEAEAVASTAKSYKNSDFDPTPPNDDSGSRYSSNDDSGSRYSSNDDSGSSSSSDYSSND